MIKFLSKCILSLKTLIFSWDETFFAQSIYEYKLFDNVLDNKILC
jgi:hypothetical protein